MNYDEISKKILINVGGKGNIDSYTSCITRLRITVKDINKINDKELEGLASRLNGLLGSDFSNSIKIQRL